MYEDLEEIIIDKPLEEATDLDFCKGTPRQRWLKEMRETSLESLKEQLDDDEFAEMAFKAFRNCKEGYMKIQRQWPSLGEKHEGWTYAFAEGLPLFINRPDRWYNTSNIQKIDWQGMTFTTLNSIYTFCFVDEKEFPKWKLISARHPETK